MLYELKDWLGFERLPKKGRYLRYYLAGFADGEASFSVSIKKHPQMKFGWVIDPVFQVYQHKKNLAILELFRRVLNCGYIKPKSPKSNVWVYIVSQRKALAEKVIPFFKKHKLLTQKWNDFCLFEQIIKKMQNREHTTKEGFVEIITLACKMNELGKQRKYQLHQILEEVRNK